MFLTLHCINSTSINIRVWLDVLLDEMHTRLVAWVGCRWRIILVDIWKKPIRRVVKCPLNGVKRDELKSTNGKCCLDNLSSFLVWLRLRYRAIERNNCYEHRRPRLEENDGSRSISGFIQFPCFCREPSDVGIPSRRELVFS